VPLGQIASIQVVDSPASVSREAVRRRTNVEVNVRGRDLASFVGERRRACARGALPPGYVLRWGGQFENLSAAVGAARGRRAARPRADLHPALHGVRADEAGAADLPQRALRRGRRHLPARARGMPFSISAGIGFIALFGIAVLNGVVLLTTIKKLRAKPERVRSRLHRRGPRAACAPW
jgi:cobalt-zinc-cadmium resistance protein CzcA